MRRENRKVLLMVVAFVVGFGLFSTTGVMAKSKENIKKGISQRVEDLENFFSEMKDTLLGHEERITDLEESSQESNEELQQLEDRIDQQSREIDSLIQTVESQSDRITNLRQELEEVKSEIDNDSDDHDNTGFLRIHGKVTDENGVPIENAAVKFIDEGGLGSTHTGEDGRYDSHMPKETFLVAVAEKGYLFAAKKYNNDAVDGVVEIDFVLSEAGTVEGNLYINNNVPVEHARVILYDSKGDRVNIDTIGPDGTFKLNAKEGTYTAELEADTLHQEKTVTITNGQTTILDFTVN